MLGQADFAQCLSSSLLDLIKINKLVPFLFIYLF